MNLQLMSCREVCKNEYIIPLTPDLKEMYEDESMKHSLRSFSTVSVQPLMTMSEIELVCNIFTTLMKL